MLLCETVYVINFILWCYLLHDQASSRLSAFMKFVFSCINVTVLSSAEMNTSDFLGKAEEENFEKCPRFLLSSYLAPNPSLPCHLTQRQWLPSLYYLFLFVFLLSV